MKSKRKIKSKRKSKEDKEQEQEQEQEQEHARVQKSMREHKCEPTEQARVVLVHAVGREHEHQTQGGAGRTALVARGCVREAARQGRLARATQPPQHKGAARPLRREPPAQTPLELRPRLEAPVRRPGAEARQRGREVERRPRRDAAVGERAVAVGHSAAFGKQALLVRGSALSRRRGQQLFLGTRWMHTRSDTRRTTCRVRSITRQRHRECTLLRGPSRPSHGKAAGRLLGHNNGCNSHAPLHRGSSA